MTTTTTSSATQSKIFGVFFSTALAAGLVMAVLIFLRADTGTPPTQADEIGAIHSTTAFLNTLKVPTTGVAASGDVVEAVAFVNLQFGANPFEKITSATTGTTLTSGYNVVVYDTLSACISYSSSSAKWSSHTGTCSGA